MPNAPDSPAACVVVVASPDAPTLLGRRFFLGASTRVGGSADDDVSLAGEGVLEGHARIARAGSLRLEAMAGPVTVVGTAGRRQVRPGDGCDLASGDQLVLGRSHLRVLEGRTPQALQDAYHNCIYRLTIVDAATGIYNRRWLAEALGLEMLRARSADGRLSVVMLDVLGLDRLARDRGAIACDEALRVIGSRLTASREGLETVARWDETELAVLLPGAAAEAAAERALSMARAAAEPIDLAPIAVLTVAAGVASLEATDATAQDLVERAMSAMHAATAGSEDGAVTSES